MARAVEGYMSRDFTNKYNNKFEHCGSAERQAANVIAVPTKIGALSNAHSRGKGGERRTFKTMDEAGAA